MTPMRVLVTGGAGFLGSHLCDRLLAEGHDVIAMDNLLTGNARNIAHLAEEKRFRFVRHDVSQFIFVDGPLDAVLHFASPASPIDYLELPIQTLKVGSLGTHKALGLAKEKNARFLLASTSEVYGDPLVHPQPESYWGNVNPIGPRGVYDEAKRFAESMTMAYHRAHGVDTRIVRIFNSILADQPVLLFNDEQLHIEPIADYARRVELLADRPREVLVPAFNPATMRMELRAATALIQHPAMRDAFELRLRYGRSVKVTGDHSVFVRGAKGMPEARPVRELRVGDHVAIPGRLPVVERDRVLIRFADEVLEKAGGPEELWEWAVRHPSLRSQISERREEIHEVLEASGRFAATRFRNNLVCTTNKWMRGSYLPLFVLRRLSLPVPPGSQLRPYRGGLWLRNEIVLTDDLLWLFGFFLAEGAEHSGEGTHFVSFCSDTRYLRKAKSIIRRRLGGHPGLIAPGPGRGPSLYVHSRLLHRLFCKILQLRERRIPAWVMQLPLSRVKHFLEGFRCGDGTHSGKKVGHELAFETSSETLSIDLTFLLLRFGIVASVGKYETTFQKRYGERRFPFFRVTVCEVDDFDILNWDSGVTQTLNARRIGDLVWSRVKEIRPCLLSADVYDFSVPGAENFVAGNGVCCHNTFGPRMRPRDGRVVPALISQALAGDPMTVFGDGSQTRSFCYVSDLVDGIYRLLLSNEADPVNIGNPVELSVLKFAERIRALTGSRSEIVFKPLPVDDPKVRQPDITRAREKLGWSPRVDLEEGLRRTIDYFRALPG